MRVLFGIFIAFSIFLGDGEKTLKKINGKKAPTSQKCQSANLRKHKTDTKILL